MKLTLLGRCQGHVVAVLLLLGGTRVCGFRGENEASRKPPEAPPRAPTVARRELSRDQREAARRGTADGLRVDWHSHFGTPASLRGRALGERRDFSGGLGRNVRGGPDLSADAVAVLDNLSRFYRIGDAAKEFAVRRVETDALGFRHVRLAQVHHGRPVFGGEVTVHFDGTGQPYQVSGPYVPDIDVGIVPGLDTDEAVRRAQRDLAALHEPPGVLRERPAEVIFAWEAEPRLAYEVKLRTRAAKSGPGRWRFWIDAQNGAVLLRLEERQKIAPPTLDGTNALIRGSILTGEGGHALSITGWYEYTGFHYLHSHDWRWSVYNGASDGWPDAGTYAHRVDADWGDSDPAAMSLARNFDVVQRYFREVHGRLSYDGSNALAHANAHAGRSLVNAFWDPESAQFFFGDGDGVEAGALAALDICGHEFTHAVTAHTAGLIPAHEPGALSESFSDILGACVEFHAQADGRGFYPDKATGTADWLAGEDSWISSVALRDLRNPRNAATVGAGNEQPSRYRGTHWYNGPGDNGGVHFNSGVQNFFFYLLSEGGSGDNDGIAYHVAGLGITNAARVAYRALTVYCTPHTDYPAVRSAWISAAMDLDSNWVSSVSAAWAAVGVGVLHVTPGGAVTWRAPAGGPFDPSAPSFSVFNRGTETMPWIATSAEAWLKAVPDRGIIPAGGSNLVRLSLEAAEAASLGPGLHANMVSFSSSVETAVHHRPVNLLVGQPDYFTEIFEEADNDLEFQSWTFTPDGSAGFYAVCREAASRFPTDPAGGESVALTDDSFATVTLTGTNSVSLYGRRTNLFFIGSNGYITLASPDFSYNESVAAHFARPRVAGCFDDLNPASGGAVSWRQTSDRVAVTFAQVREHGSGATVNFQIELHFDGTIRITCLGLGVTDGLTGLSAGTGVPPGFLESDLAAYRSCPRQDDLSVHPNAGFTSLGIPGGPWAPARANYLLGNSGTSAVPWTAWASEPWVTVAPSGGTLAPGATTSVTLSLEAGARRVGEGTHTTAAVFSNVVSAGAQARAVQLTVAQPTLDIGDAVVVEGNAGMSRLAFVVNLQPPATQSVTVAYATGDGTALADLDYLPAPGVLEFLPGQTRRIIQVFARGETESELNEFLFVVLADPVHARLGRAAGTGTILNDDAGVVLGPFPPGLAGPPSSRTVLVGGAATFCVSATGSDPLGFFWSRNGEWIEEATQPCYTVAPGLLSDSGSRFSCVVSNAAGLARSASATLTVRTGLVVAVFDHPLHVDTAGSPQSESDNVQASLTGRGFAVAPVTNLLAAMAAHSVLLFPEQELGAVGPVLTATERFALSNFVAHGGWMIVHGGSPDARSADLINRVFGLALQEARVAGTVCFQRTGEAMGTRFTNAPAGLGKSDTTSALETSSLPAGAHSLYETDGQSAVAVIDQGGGKIIFLGWDWCEAAPRGAQDGGWLAVLEGAVLEGADALPRPQPRIEAGFDRTRGVVSWSTAFSGRLEWAGNLDADSASWTPLFPHPPIVQSAGRSRVTLPVTDGTRYYRLRTEDGGGDGCATE